MTVFEDTTGTKNLEIVDQMSNHFVYNEQVMAAYGIYSNSYKKFEYQSKYGHRGIPLSSLRTCMVMLHQKFLNSAFNSDCSIHERI